MINKLLEIVKVKRKDKLYDILIDDDLTSQIYNTYFKLLKLSKKLKANLLARL